MTINANDVAREQPPVLAREQPSVSIGFPVTVGWTQAAMAVHSVLRLNTPINLTIYAHWCPKERSVYARS